MSTATITSPSIHHLRELFPHGEVKLSDEVDQQLQSLRLSVQLMARAEEQFRALIDTQGESTDNAFVKLAMEVNADTPADLAVKGQARIEAMTTDEFRIFERDKTIHQGIFDLIKDEGGLLKELLPRPLLTGLSLKVSRKLFDIYTAHMLEQFFLTRYPFIRFDVNAHLLTYVRVPKEGQGRVRSDIVIFGYRLFGTDRYLSYDFLGAPAENEPECFKRFITHYKIEGDTLE